MPESSEHPPVIDLVVEPRGRDLDGMPIRRVLPAAERGLIGPFIFLDHIGPVDLAPGHGVDVRPHPHINLETVTYLFAGELDHRDSLGYHQTIRPGEVNWMTAGRGIAHSERTGSDARRQGSRVYGIQMWLALPTKHEETEPAFHHHPAATLPQIDRDGVEIRVLAGSAYGVTSPVRTFSRLFCAAARARAGTALAMPSEYPERAAYLLEGTVRCDGQRIDGPRLVVFKAGGEPTVEIASESRLMLFGGAPVGEPRYIWWNFVSSSKERIEQAKADWQAGRFGRVVGDEHEFIPLPEI
jgi:redox-sensitive bicupin YhaK (pirin superfamily)